MADPWLDPLVVIDKGLRFEHSAEDVAAARDFAGSVEGPDERSLARAIVTRVHERMRVLPTAFGLGMPKTLRGIVAAGGGNCVSHTVLATVLLRHRGLRTRLVGEKVYTNFSVLRVPAMVVRAPVGPTLNGHVWIETFADGEWVPADAELGIIGVQEWLAARVVNGATVPWGVGIPIREHWKFPLDIERLGPDGMSGEDVTHLYLIDRPGAALGGAAALPPAWVEGVEYFSRRFPWDGWAGLRILREHRRLRDMSRALGMFSATLVGQPPGIAPSSRME